MPGFRIGRLSLAVFALLGALGAAAPAQAEAAAEVLSPLVATPLTSPNPVLGSDNKTHLAYEFMLVNMAPSVLTVEKVETLEQRLVQVQQRFPQIEEKLANRIRHHSKLIADN